MCSKFWLNMFKHVFEFIKWPFKLVLLRLVASPFGTFSCTGSLIVIIIASWTVLIAVVILARLKPWDLTRVMVICHDTFPRPGQVHTPVYHCEISRTWWSSVMTPPPDQGRYTHQYTTVRYHTHCVHLSWHLPQTRAGTHTSIPLWDITRMVVICHDTSPRPGQVHTQVYH